MQVILTQNVEKLGRRGDIKNVKAGYYRNFLAPQGFAKAATPKLLKWAKKLQEEALKQKEEIIKRAKEFKEKLEATVFKLEMKTTDKDTLYGAINEKKIVELLKEQAKIEIDKKQVDMQKPIKTVGLHTVSINLSEDVKAEIKIEVIAKGDKK
jgi:large subunit ribosomal protein L9